MDLRDFIAQCERHGDLKRVTAEVDWNLEMSHIAKLMEERDGPAVLFENVKDHPDSGRVLFGAYSNTRRLATVLGRPADLSMVDLSYEWMRLSVGEVIRAKEVATGPVFENTIDEDDVDILRQIPSPKFYERDGGRYIGTACFMVVKDPETGEINLGTYRSQVLDSKTVGAQILKGKRGDRILQKYRKMGQKMPICLIVGCDPLLMLAGSAMVENANEYDVVGTLRGEPVQVVSAPLTGLPVPADAEWVLEGYIDGDNPRLEGPFGEYTGYYTEELFHPVPKPAIDVKRIHHRDDPIFLAASVGRPVNDNHMMLAFVRNATLWTELTKMGIPGVKSVYMPPGGVWAVLGDRLGEAALPRSRRPGRGSGHREQHVHLRAEGPHRRRRGHQGRRPAPGVVGAGHPLRRGPRHPDHQPGPVHAAGPGPGPGPQVHHLPHRHGRDHPLRVEGEAGPGPDVARGPHEHQGALVGAGAGHGCGR